MSHLFLPLKSAQFRKYSAATVLSAIGNGMHFVAMSWFLYQHTGAVTSIGLMLITSMLPAMFLSPIAGVLVDRWNEKWICVAVDTLRGLIFACLVLALYYDHWVLPAIYISAFLVATCNLFYSPALSAMVRDISTKENLLNANVLGSTSQQVGLLCGASLGGFLVAEAGAVNVILLNAASFFVSAMLIAWIRKTSHEHSKSAPRSRHAWGELRETLEYVKQHRFIIWLAVVQMLDTVVLCVTNTILPVFVSKELAGGPEAFGLIDAAWGGGAILGGILLSYLARHVDRHKIMIIGPAALALLLMVFLTSQNTAQAIVGYFLLGLCVCAVGINTNTVLVADVDPAYFGKIKSAIAMFISYISLAVYGLLSLFGDLVSSRWIYAALSAFVMAGVVVKLVRMYRQGSPGQRDLQPAAEDSAA
ncbi:MFS transporter [Chitinimonas viridis]|uniref:MFS transporter n=1 Tax=Chitinimonas viridis TaxID=664880 RepID=A0ABT8B4C0_9NEIS|nr:MFS transporter [Chitinimonas viridis]MDN3576670.1 MFS transporter [Chitinimonas viridis]